jgi:3-hydroxybutyryl-CoA dehydratase
MNESCRELRYHDIALHDRASFSAVIDKKVIEEFAVFSGDFNPLHTNEEYANSTQFHGRVAHGMIVGVFFSRLVGMYLPGKYSVYLSQTLHFHHPIELGVEITVDGEVVHKTDAYQTIEIRTTAIDAKTKEILVSGEAMVKLLQ